jgi:predicted nucleic acid-binding protein
LTTFVDTSALFALLDEDDSNHRKASKWLAGPGRDPSEVLVTHAYVVVEAAALVHRCLGDTAARVLLDALVPALSIRFVDESLHRAAVNSYIAGLRRTSPSLVDWVSFVMMRDQAIERAFAFDRDYTLQGFETVP